MFRIRKMFKFDCAHKLASSYYKPCQRIHGHSYKLELFLKSKKLNEDGMIVDFAYLKEILGQVVNQFDHKFIVFENDEDAGGGEELTIVDQNILDNLGFLYVEFNPTAENMARFFYEQIEAVFYKNEELRNILIEAVRIHETETGWAEYSK